MSNASIVERMHVVLDQYEFGKLSTEAVEKSIRFHMEALECINLDWIRRAGDLTYRLVRSHYSAGMEEFIDVQAVKEVLSDFRRFFDEIPRGPIPPTAKSQVV